MPDTRKSNPFGARREFGAGAAVLYSLPALERAGLGAISRLPVSIRILLESVLRNVDGRLITEDDVKALAAWSSTSTNAGELAFRPARVILQDFTGVPAVVDLASMRSAVKRLGGDPAQINPLVPVDLVIDHSVQVDAFGTPRALAFNAEIEFERNRERYEFLRWGQKAFRNFRVVPPATGIVHQVNLEYLAKVVVLSEVEGDWQVFPDTLVGTDSHTTMINGLGVLGWGVGGIEAEAAMLGQPCYMLTPQVVGFKLHGRLREGVNATDLVLTATEMLRKKGVVEKFVEFYGTGLSQMSLPDRATIANMAPEYGATMGFFPVDDETLRYLRATGRTDEEVERVERYTKEQGLFRTDSTPDPAFSDTLELDLGAVETTLAGPKRPQDRVPLSRLKESFRKALTAPTKERGFGLADADLSRTATVQSNGTRESLGHGAVVIAAITSCTNTSNPSVMLAAGLLAQKAAERGLKPPAYVKTSLAPGSKVVSDYLQEAGVMPGLESLGFDIVGYGCTTCIGNSGPLPEAVAGALNENPVVAAAVLSGNRNFEGRIHPQVKANYLSSPPLVVAFALAGTVDIDLNREPLGRDPQGRPVHLRDIWPSRAEVDAAMQRAVRPEMFRRSYANIWDGNPTWNAVPVSGGDLYDFKPESTYIQEPPFFTGMTRELPPLRPIRGARVLALFGDSITTDHISPAGDIALNSPAGKYLSEHGVEKRDFNSYGSRRGNDRVMVRGTFANIRLKNLMLPGTEGGVTLHLPDREQMTIYDAAMRYQSENVPLLVIAGKEYGAGSSRDWAAKGTLLLGVHAVIAETYERIHRSNLVGMGVLPLVFKPGESAASLGLTGEESYDVEGLASDIRPRQELTVTATAADGSRREFQVIARLDSQVDVDYYRNGGILQTVLRSLARTA
ncbi:MAG TPA: aconitate hydratase AcnA [Terriglobia bacterium]|jgi:aconitate hydratase|nr:aconitate hydratase AcnA [Terriglobia bacterium]